MILKQLIRTLIVNFKPIVTISVSGTVTVFLYFLLAAPLTFISKVSILPPENSPKLGLSSLLAGGDISSLMSGSQNLSSQLYAELMRSRVSLEYVVRKNQLLHYYKTETMTSATAKLLNELNLEVTKEGVLKLYVPVKSGYFQRFSDKKEHYRELASGISSSFLEVLDSLNKTRMISKAQRAREYIEVELSKTKAQLDTAEQRLVFFQKSNRSISLPEQLRVAIESAAKVKSEIVNTEITLGVLSENLSPDHPNILELKSKLNGLRKQYNKFEVGNNDFLLSFAGAPELGLKLADLTREVKILNEVYLFLQQQYYQEKIQENKETSTIEILDEAKLPERETEPRVLYSTFFSGIFIFVLVFLFYLSKDMNVLRYLRNNLEGSTK